MIYGANKGILKLNPYIYLRGDSEYFTSTGVLATDGQTVTTWGDKTRNSRDSNTIDSTTKPLWRSATKTIEWDGVNDCLTFGDIGNSVFTGSFTVVFKVAINVLTTNNFVLTKNWQDASNRQFFLLTTWTGTNTTLRWGSSSNGTALTLDLSTTIASGGLGTYFTGALTVDRSQSTTATRFKFRFNNVSQTTTVAASTNEALHTGGTGQLQIGRGLSGSGSFKGNWKGIAIFPYALTESQHQIVYKELNSI